MISAFLFGFFCLALMLYKSHHENVKTIHSFSSFNFKFFVFSKQRTPVSVSYTHLDVYKRQELLITP